MFYRATQLFIRAMARKTSIAHEKQFNPYTIGVLVIHELLRNSAGSSVTTNWHRELH